jgi:hypothetical protein
MSLDGPRHGWWTPVPLGSGYVRAHYVLPDGWSLCGRWRRVDAAGRIFSDLAALAAFPDKSLRCKECLTRWRHRGRKSKLVVGLRKAGVAPRPLLSS